ncbi:MAG: hypothetical protein PVJ09_00060 [Candidatus Woesebacteria bacterium]|jgi:hypothetical protein
MSEFKIQLHAHHERKTRQTAAAARRQLCQLGFLTDVSPGKGKFLMEKSPGQDSHQLRALYLLAFAIPQQFGLYKVIDVTNVFIKVQQLRGFRVPAPWIYERGDLKQYFDQILKQLKGASINLT